MLHISLLLERFKNLGLKEFLIKEDIAKIISEKCGVNISAKDITYTEGLLTIKGSRSLKSELFLRKQEIVDEIENKFARTKISRVL